MNERAEQVQQDSTVEFAPFARDVPSGIRKFSKENLYVNKAGLPFFSHYMNILYRTKPENFVNRADEALKISLSPTGEGYLYSYFVLNSIIKNGRFDSQQLEWAAMLLYPLLDEQIDPKSQMNSTYLFDIPIRRLAIATKVQIKSDRAEVQDNKQKCYFTVNNENDRKEFLQYILSEYYNNVDINILRNHQISDSVKIRCVSSLLDLSLKSFQQDNKEYDKLFDILSKN